MTFEQLNLIPPILQALKTEGYTNPTPIQAQSIPFVLQGNDLLGCAQTGTGKTAAFSIPIIQLMVERSKQNHTKQAVKCLILTPTRELAIQIGESINTYGKHTNLKSKVIFGGVNQHGQVEALRRGVDILVATPGRLLDLIDQRHIQLNQLDFFVLDEADRMLDMGFVHDVKRILKLLPSKKQTLFFSATMPSEIVKLANTILVDPKKVEVAPVSSTAETIDQEIYFVDKGNKRHLLVDLLKDDALERVLVFARTKHGCDRIVKDLAKKNIKAKAIHGNKSQNARQNALNSFKDKEIRVLVATDIAARGIDIDDLAFVINYDLPNIPESYVHRIGRTGRAGTEGKAIAFCDAVEKEYLRDIEKLIGKKIPVIENVLYPLVEHDAEKPKQRPQRNRNNRNEQKPKPIKNRNRRW